MFQIQSKTITELYAGLACISAAISPLGAMAQPKTHSENDTNIIFILVDDMGYGELSCYYPKTPTPTPNIDRLAQSGVMMTQAYAAPVSSPTRAAFLTGYHPQNVGVYGNWDGTAPGIGPMRESYTPKLKELGYTTAWFGKWHQGWDVSNHPLNNGFDQTYGFLGGMHDFYDPAEGDLYYGGPFSKNCYIFDGIKPVTEMKYLTEELTDQTVSFIEDQKNKTNPFYIYLAYNAPHTPFQAPDNATVKYLKKGYDAIEATRYAMMDVLDEQVGRVIDILEETNQRNNTLIIFMSDNGPETTLYSGDLRGKKMTAWEGGIRVPMIASLPGVIPQGTKSDAICSIVDMASTFFGTQSSDDNYKYGDGVNLMPYYKGIRSGNAHDTLVISINPHCKPYEIPKPENMQLLAVRMGDWKLVYDKPLNVNAIYNLKEDIGEQNDLSESHPDIKEEMWEYSRKFLRNAKPESGKIRGIDTRRNGDSIKYSDLRKHCELLKIKFNIK